MKKRNIVPKKIKDTKSRIRHCCLVGCFADDDDDVSIVIWGFGDLGCGGFCEFGSGCVLEIGADEDGVEISGGLN